MSIRSKRVLFLVPYPTEGASARLRVEQFLPFLKEAGIEYKVRPFLTAGFYRILYRKGNTARKIVLFLFCSCRRLFDLVRALLYDVVFIHRESMPVGLPVIEAMLFLFGKKVIFDFDDAIYLPPQGSSFIVSLLKCPWKTNFIIRHSCAVIAGNEYLKRCASRFSSSISVIPTCIDTDRYKRYRANDKADAVVIGWIGSHTTQVFLKDVQETLLSLLGKYEKLKIYLIGAKPNLMHHDRVLIKNWSLGSELDDMNEFDIGIMPMPDTEWTRGKCAFKAILYMSLEVPVVASPVGVNRDIIKDGINGYLAGTNAEWEEKLMRLVDDACLRRSIGSAGRATAIRDFSLKANAPIFVDIIKRSSGNRADAEAG